MVLYVPKSIDPRDMHIDVFTELISLEKQSPCSVSGGEWFLGGSPPPGGAMPGLHTGEDELKLRISTNPSFFKLSRGSREKKGILGCHVVALPHGRRFVQAVCVCVHIRPQDNPASKYRG
jgi:hypothetical protein